MSYNYMLIMKDFLILKTKKINNGFNSFQSGSVQSIISIHAKNGLTKLINDYQCYDII